MKKSEKRILANSNISNLIHTSSIKNTNNNDLNREIERLSLKLDKLTKENENLKMQNTKLKEELQNHTNEKNYEQKFSNMIIENKKLKENFIEFKEEFLKNRNKLEQSEYLNKCTKGFSQIEKNLAETLNFLENNLKFFREETNFYSEKLSHKQIQYDSLYLKYVLEEEKLCNFIKDNENLRQENSRLKIYIDEFHNKLEKRIVD